MRLAKHALGIIGIVSVALGLSAPASAADKVSLQLIWDHQFQFAGFYAANWNGYYAEAGIEVEIRSGIAADGSIVQTVPEVSSGRADFGLSGANLLVARDKGVPLVVLAAIFQQSPTAFYAKEEAGLRSPADMTRLRVASSAGGVTEVELRSMLRSEGIDPSSVHLYPQEPGLRHLKEGRVDVVPGYTLATPWVGRQLGLKLTSLRPSAYGVDFYGDTLFAHQRLLAYSRMQPLDSQSTDLNKLISEIRTLLDPVVGSSISVELALADDLAAALIDAARMEAAILNMAGNARDAPVLHRADPGRFVDRVNLL